MIPYAIRYNRGAVRAIYQIERGIAAEVTLAIKLLTREPIPNRSFALDELPNTYVIKVADYYITYEIDENTHSILIGLIEKVTSQLP